MKLCERCHKERDESDFAQIATVGVFCSWCREQIQMVIDEYGVEAATGWTYHPRTDLLDLIEGEHKRVLDCGCWAGYTLEELRRRGHQPMGLDIQDNRKTAKDVPFFEVDLMQPDVSDWDGLDELDYIIFGDVIEHLENPAFAFMAAKLWLAKKGRIIISVPNAGWIGSVCEIVNQNFPRDESGHFDKTHMRFYTRNVLNDTLIEAGFRPLKYYSRQLPSATVWPEGAEGTQAFQWGNVTIACDKDLFDQLNTYQILAVAEVA